MAKTHKKTGIANTLPGTIYDRHGRYWYKAQLPGEAKPVARPLVPLGSKYATTDYCAAVELAKDLYHQAIFKSQKTDLTILISDNQSCLPRCLNLKCYYKCCS